MKAFILSRGLLSLSSWLWMSRWRSGKHTDANSHSRSVNPADVEAYRIAIVGTSSSTVIAGSHENALQRLHAEFEQRSVRSELLGEAWWLDFLSAISQDDVSGLEVQARLQKHILENAPEALHFREWLHFYVLALQFGLFELGHVLRTRARNVAVTAIFQQQRPTDSRLYFRALAALAELGCLEQLQSELNYLGDEFPRERSEIEFLINLMSGKPSPKPVIKKESDREFVNFINGKTVALVGPAKTSNHDGEKIDSFDLVARCNYKEAGIGVDKEIKGLRCNISYYNTHQTTHIINKDLRIPPPGVEWAVFRKETDLKAWQDVTENNASLNGQARFRSLPGNGYSAGLFRGHLTAIPAALLDLLRLGVGNVTLFHCDLMLTVDRNKDYKAHAQNTQEHLQRFIKSCSGSHDPVTQFAILKMVFASGRVNGDAGVQKLIKMTEVDYMRALQSLYGNSARLGQLSIEKLA